MRTAAALLAACAAAGCSQGATDWRKLAEAPYERMMGAPRRSDNAYGSPPGQLTVRVDAVAEAGRGWLVKLDDAAARGAFESACAGAVGDDGFRGASLYVPLRSFGAGVEAEARQALDGFLARTPDAPTASSLTAGPYLWVTVSENVLRDALLTDCLDALTRQAPAHASLAKALGPVAAERDALLKATFERVREEAGGRLPEAPPPSPITIVWFGEDPKPFLIGAPVLAEITPSLSDPVEVCGFDPATSNDLAVDACERLLLTDARRASKSPDALPREVVGRWLRSSLEKARQPGAMRLERRDVVLEGRRSESAR